MKARLEVFKEMFSAEATSPVSYVWAMENILGFSKSEIKLILKQKKVEKKIFAEIDSAVEMYKKIGLFRELDEKYEIPGAEEMMMKQQAGGDEEGGGEEGGGFGGGGGFDMGGGLDMGGAEELGGEAGGAEAGGEAGGDEAGGEEVPLAESRFNRAMKASDNYTSSLINELLGSDEEKKPSKIEDNALIRRSNDMKLESQKLINRIQTSLVNIGMGKEVIKESDLSQNSLINNSNKIGQDSENLMSEIERYLRNRNINNNA